MNIRRGQLREGLRGQRGKTTKARQPVVFDAQRAKKMERALYRRIGLTAEYNRRGEEQKKKLGRTKRTVPPQDKHRPKGLCDGTDKAVRRVVQDWLKEKRKRGLQVSARTKKREKKDPLGKQAPSQKKQVARGTQPKPGGTKSKKRNASRTGRGNAKKVYNRGRLPQ